MRERERERSQLICKFFLSSNLFAKFIKFLNSTTSQYLALLHVYDEEYNYGMSCESANRLCGHFNKLRG